MPVVEIEILNQEGLNNRIDAKHINPEDETIGDEKTTEERHLTFEDLVLLLNKKDLN